MISTYLNAVKTGPCSFLKNKSACTAQLPLRDSAIIIGGRGSKILQNKLKLKANPPVLNLKLNFQRHSELQSCNQVLLFLEMPRKKKRFSNQ